jgi:hypothetical protein
MPRKPQHVCILPDNRRVTFRVSLRDGQPSYLVFFRGPDGRRLEKTTNERSQKRAIDAAQQVILQEHQPKSLVKVVSWDDTFTALVKAMRANNKWQGWRLPILFFTVKSFIGNRIDELASLRSNQLRDGRIVFPADITKGRKERKAILPPELFAELQGIAGPTYVWEKYAAQLIERRQALGKQTHMVSTDFAPARLKWWLQNELASYFKANPEAQRFTAHSFRKKAMTEAWRLGIPLEKAAVAFGCNPTTMRAHYIAMDETAIADEVLTAVAKVVEGKQN